ncbi:IS66 family insertion sequence element accessory protein TnpB [Paracoccus sp. Z330]|uniref:IS66 family insertion sequence element accessory protein TnpB n=1 Tax=Paracoccus onchidii TaxID=3017813 RepID=A0ABT4ZLU5_9RHOB|nr:IS66 family insertion sequence element accessory protein TnpB [Paracoccus onchidii]MDB6179731.1 IS66 family insertion sequence element accessory protein TnpB [Paracoccus onchidii]
MEEFATVPDGLAALAQSMLAEDPFTGTIFVFRAKRVDRLKMPFWNRSVVGSSDRVSPASGKVCDRTSVPVPCNAFCFIELRNILLYQIMLAAHP